VIACNNDGVWNDTGATLEFNVAPAWFQTIWFRILCGALAILLVWGIYTFRVQQIASALSARFDERLAERTRLAQELHDTFLQTVQGSKLIAEDALDADADQNRMRQALEKLSRWLGQAVDEGRAALHSLRVTTTEKNHLSDALRRATEDHQLPSSMTVAFSVIGDPKICTRSFEMRFTASAMRLFVMLLPIQGQAVSRSTFATRTISHCVSRITV